MKITMRSLMLPLFVLTGLPLMFVDRCWIQCQVARLKRMAQAMTRQLIEALRRFPISKEEDDSS
jgi:hypothetical protein